jgi:hypothetical protein
MRSISATTSGAWLGARPMRVTWPLRSMSTCSTPMAYSMGCITPL